MIFTRSADQLQNERQLVPASLMLMALVVGSSALLWLLEMHTGGRQLTLLLHILAGLALVALVVPYVVIHFRRTAYFRRPSMMVSGFLLVGAMLVLFATGLHIVWAGQRQNLSWIPLLHGVAAVLFLVLLVLHLLDHVFRMPARRRGQQPETFLSVSVRNLALPLLLLAFLPALYLLGNTLVELEPAPQSPQVANYEMAYGDHPFRPSQTETAHGGFVAVTDVAGSENCAVCHTDIAEQWQASVHRQAASDPTYVTNINLLEGKKGIAATRYCEGCHAPVALLTGELSETGRHGGVSGTVANLEGVSCMSCHGVHNMVHLKGVASYEFTPRQDYLFEHAANPVGRAINRLLLRADPGQHRRDLGAPLLAEPEFCAGCHAQFMDKDMNGWGWVKMQDEYSAWLASPFSGHEDAFSDQDRTTCVDCHMPMIQSDDPSANESGLVRSHYFPGGNTVLPLLAGNTERYEEVVRFLQGNRIRLTIDQPNRADSRQDLRPLDENIRGIQEAPYYAYLGETVELNLIVSNRGVGHDFPAGTIDLGEAWIDFTVLDAQGDPVFQRAYPDAHVYKATPVGRDGREVWRHDLFNMIGESFRRVIPAGESDLVSYEFRVPAWARSPLTVSATLRYRKLNERYARFGLGDLYVQIPIVDVAWDSLIIPLRTRQDVENLIDQ